MNDKESRTELERLKHLILETREKAPLPVSAVIHACDVLSQSLNEREHLHLLLDLGLSEHKARKELQTMKQMISKEYLENRMKIEFGESLGTVPVRQEWLPIGVLLHIAAGNVDVLPAFSVIEGLLTGNINILKLPGNDNGMSVSILRELMKIEPLIVPYVFVFDYHSHDMEAMKELMSTADGIVIWGGDAAVSAVRRAANPDTRIIEWGHKISFAYVSGNVSDYDLEGIAYNICDTSQLLCSSCQGIFLDTEDFDQVLEFAGRFVRILERMAAEIPDGNLYLMAQKTIELYTERLESVKSRKQVFYGDNCSVTAYNSMSVMPSYMYRNCWVGPLPRKRLLGELIKYKNHLQTVALICEECDKAAIETILAKTGIVRITNGARMSEGYCGMPHDGEFSLRRYMKLMSYEY